MRKTNGHLNREVQPAVGNHDMSSDTDLMELAHELARIASKTDDAETGRLLMLMVHRLLTEAGLPTAEKLHA
jgi:hypothetical protein